MSISASNLPYIVRSRRNIWTTIQKNRLIVGIRFGGRCGERAYDIGIAPVFGQPNLLAHPGWINAQLCDTVA